VRKAEKEKLKAYCGDLKKRRTAINKLAEKCEGEALINYGSPTQVLNVLTGMKGLAKLEDTDDDSLDEYSHVPAVEAFRDYRTLSKEIKTYGDQWVQEWKLKPSKAEGWLHPGDGRLHCVFNQLDAETGRSTSEKPNGQNLPRDKEVRGCFVADPPDESIRISTCCDAETEINPWEVKYVCSQCHLNCDTKAEEYVIVTADMSGAELRILADLANEPVWVNAFNRGEDVHCICVELMDEETWKPLALPGCAYYQLRPDGALQRKACKCEQHKTLRNDMKPMNFGIPYGISAPALSKQIKKPVNIIEERLAKHKANFERLWAYVDDSGKSAQIYKKSFDMFGRRRLFPEPTWERAKTKAMADYADELEYEENVQDRNKATFIAVQGRKPTKDEQWLLLHRLLSNKQIGRAFKAMHGSIERQGKNHPIQGTNATIAKLAMGSGFCPAGKPYLWHTLPQFKAKLLKFVHDELVVQCPKRHGQKVADLIGDAFKRAAAEKMKRVVMEFEYHIETYWMK
jgi:DNA polymerase I-like protein with 3'-5' exonuclease and polymerase domains